MVDGEEQRRERIMIEATEKRLPKGPHLNDPGVYMSGIDAMSRKELENHFPEAQEALVAIETKLEEPTGLRNAAVILAAAMLARSPPQNRLVTERNMRVSKDILR